MAYVRLLCRLMALVLFFGLGLPAARAQDAAPKKEGEAADPLGKLPGWLGGKEAQFFRLPHFHIPVIRAGQVVGQVSMSVLLETNGNANRNTIIENRTKLHNAFLRDLHGLLSLDSGSGRAVNLETVKIRLQKVADRVVGPGIVKSILVDNLYTRNFD